MRAVGLVHATERSPDRLAAGFLGCEERDCLGDFLGRYDALVG